MNGEKTTSIYDIGVKARMEETTRKTKTYVGGHLKYILER
jgi:hypothetical protein